MNSREVLSRNLRKLREERGWSQEELADRAKVDRTYVSSLERCRYAASVDMIDRLAEAFGIGPQDLLLPPY